MKLFSTTLVGLGVVVSAVAGVCYQSGTEAASAVYSVVPQATWLIESPGLALCSGFFLIIAGFFVQPPKF